MHIILSKLSLRQLRKMYRILNDDGYEHISNKKDFINLLLKPTLYRQISGGEQPTSILLQYLKSQSFEKEYVQFSIGSACTPDFLMENCREQMLPNILFNQTYFPLHEIFPEIYFTFVIIDQKINEYEYNISSVLSRISEFVEEKAVSIDIEYNNGTLAVYEFSNSHIRIVFESNHMPYYFIKDTPIRYDENDLDTISLNQRQCDIYNRYEMDYVENYYRELKEEVNRIVSNGGCVLFLNFVKFREYGTLINRYTDIYIQNRLLELLDQTNYVEMNDMMDYKPELKCQKLLLSWFGYSEKHKRLLFMPHIYRGLGNLKNRTIIYMRLDNKMNQRSRTMIVPFIMDGKKLADYIPMYKTDFLKKDMIKMLSAYQFEEDRGIEFACFDFS